MSNKPNKEKGIRLGGSYFTMVISISMVLFLVGMMGLIILNAHKIADQVKENIGISIIFKEEASTGDILKLQKSFEINPSIKSTRVITKEEAAEQLKVELGEDFIGFLGYNPLLVSMDIKLKTEFANNDSIAVMEKKLRLNPLIKEIAYQKSLVHLVNDNIRKITFGILIVSIILFLIAVTLINNTIRLAIYSRRFIINTMQLVGATRYFIRKPFMKQALIIGAVSSTIAMLAIVAIMNYSDNYAFGLFSSIDQNNLLYLNSFVFLSGILLNYISTFFAVNKYLNIKTDHLYN